jgi:hypothetical protein
MLVEAASQSPVISTDGLPAFDAQAFSWPATNDASENPSVKTANRMDPRAFSISQ